MTLTTKFLGATAVLALSASAVAADPAILFDLGGKFDKSFNESAFNGAQRWAEETGGSYAEVEINLTHSVSRPCAVLLSQVQTR
jgi:basic membrane protein A